MLLALGASFDLGDTVQELLEIRNLALVVGVALADAGAQGVSSWGRASKLCALRHDQPAGDAATLGGK